MVEFPYRYGVTPPQAASFQHRTATAHVAHVVSGGDTAVLTSDGPASTSVLSGLGGVGKTQLALDYAEHLWASGGVELLVWISATSRDAIVSHYARLATDLTGVEESDPDHGARRLLSWLSTTAKRWLVVLDDVQTPADVRGLWPPATGRGRVVVTTRRRDAALRGHRRRLIEIDVFTDTEAVAYLAATLADRPHLLDGAAELVHAMGYLPLALAQAGAYMLDRNLPCARYLERWADRRRRLVSLVPEHEGLPDEHQATVAVTWSLSVEQANRLTPVGMAAPLLEVASLLDANGIPAQVSTAVAVLDLLAGSTAGAVDAELAQDGLGCLHRLSLITLDDEMPGAGASARTVRVHALVQRAIRETLSDARFHQVARAAADALLGVWPAIEHDTDLATALRSNTAALRATSSAHLWAHAGHGVLFRAGTSLYDAGLLADATRYFQDLGSTAYNSLGASHPDTLTARYHLATLYDAGDPRAAMTQLETLLVDRSRVLGPDHPDTLSTRCALAYWRGRAGDPTGAVAQLAQLLSDRLRVSGPDNPDTFLTRNRLAAWSAEAGDLVGSVVQFERLLADQLRVLGADHLYTLAVRNNLAYWRGMAGDPVGAVAEFEQVVKDKTRVFGRDHPETLYSRNNLAHWSGEAGNPTDAVAQLEELIVVQSRVLPKNHPYALNAREKLAYWRSKLDSPGMRDDFVR
jgi:hypothetical protein